MHCIVHSTVQYVRTVHTFCVQYRTYVQYVLFTVRQYCIVQLTDIQAGQCIVQYCTVYSTVSVLYTANRMGVLPVFVGMRIRLTDKISSEAGLVFCN